MWRHFPPGSAFTYARSLTTVALLLTAAACQSEKIDSSSRLRAAATPPLKLSEIPYPVDPVANSDSPIRVSVTKCAQRVNYDYTFCASASGAVSGRYWYGWYVAICDVNDSCGEFDMYASGDDLSSFAYVVPPYAAYVEVQAVARESGSANYTTYKSTQLLARGPQWAQGAGFSPNVPCASNSYPLVETQDSSGTQVTRHYSRNYCTGQKEFDPNGG